MKIKNFPRGIWVDMKEREFKSLKSVSYVNSYNTMLSYWHSVGLQNTYTHFSSLYVFTALKGILSLRYL